MPKKVYKYSIPNRSSDFTVDLPIDAVAVHVAVQDFEPQMWAIVDTASEIVTRTFTVVGTGHTIPAGAVYIGSWQSSIFVWHLFEILPS